VRGKRTEWLLLALILLLAAGLRCYRLDAQSLWNDEGTSVALALRDLPPLPTMPPPTSIPGVLLPAALLAAPGR
jgi:hypothetical protein